MVLVVTGRFPARIIGHNDVHVLFRATRRILICSKFCFLETKIWPTWPLLFLRNFLNNVNLPWLRWLLQNGAMEKHVYFVTVQSNRYHINGVLPMHCVMRWMTECALTQLICDMTRDSTQVIKLHQTLTWNLNSHFVNDSWLLLTS